IVDVDLAVLHVLGMDEQDVVDHAQLLEQQGTDEAVEVTPGHEPILRVRHDLSLGTLSTKMNSRRLPILAVCWCALSKQARKNSRGVLLGAGHFRISSVLVAVSAGGVDRRQVMKAPRRVP